MPPFEGFDEKGRGWIRLWRDRVLGKPRRRATNVSLAAGTVA